MERTQLDTGLVESPWDISYDQRSDYDSPWVQQDNGQASETRERSYCIGFKHPNFKARKARGELLRPTDWTRFRQKATSWGSYSTVYTSSGYGLRRQNYAAGLLDYVWLTEEEVEAKLTSYWYPALPESPDRLLQIAADRIYTEGWDMLTFIAEFKKTKKMFTGISKRWAKALHNGDFASLWLEGRYGWRPLVYDAKNFAESVAKLQLMLRRFQRYEESNVVIQSDSITIPTPGWVSNVISADTILQEKVNLSVRANIVADFMDSIHVNLNPVQTAWELVPYSFVLDWFVDVGSAIAATSLRLSVNHVAGVTVVAEFEREAKSLPPVSASGWSTSFSMGARSTGKYISRRPTSIPIKPFIDVNLDPAKVVDAIALIIKARRASIKQ